MFHGSFGKPAARINHSLLGCFSSYLILTGYTCVSTVLMRPQFNCYQVVLLNPAHCVSARPLWSLLLSQFPASWPQPTKGCVGYSPHRCRALHWLSLSCVRFLSAHLFSLLGAPWRVAMRLSVPTAPPNLMGSAHLLRVRIVSFSHY